MAQQVPSASAPHARVIAAINGNHRDRSFSGLSHYDASEIQPDGTEIYVSGSAPTTIATVATTLNLAKTVLNDHYQRHNGGDGSNTFAHKTADNANTIAAADMDGAALESAFFLAAKTLYLAWRTAYSHHIANKKPDESAGVYHGAADTTNILGSTSSTISDKYELAVELNNAKAQLLAHVAFTAGGVHGAADVTNVVTSANANGDDWDSIRTLVNELKADLNAHMANAGGSYHTGSDGDDTDNTISAASVSYPAGLFTLCDAINTSYTAHRQSTTYHEGADSSNTLAAGTFPTTSAALLISNAVLIQTKINAHIRNAPAASRALRVV
jgi:hypothetical protein